MSDGTLTAVSERSAHRRRHRVRRLRRRPWSSSSCRGAEQPHKDRLGAGGRRDLQAAPRPSRVSAKAKKPQQPCSALANVASPVTGACGPNSRRSPPSMAERLCMRREHTLPVLHPVGELVTRASMPKGILGVGARSLDPERDGHRGRGCRRHRGGASAAVAARSVDRLCSQRSRRSLEVRRQRHELGDAGLRLGQLGGDDRSQLVLDGATPAAVPGQREVGDLVQRAAQLLGPSDEGRGAPGSARRRGGNPRRCDQAAGGDRSPRSSATWPG